MIDAVRNQRDDHRLPDAVGESNVEGKITGLEDVRFGQCADQKLRVAEIVDRVEEHVGALA